MNHESSSESPANRLSVEPLKARPSEGGCLPWYAAREGEGVDGAELVEAPRDTPNGDGVLGMEYCNVREGVDTGEGTYDEVKERCVCGLVPGDRIVRRFFWP